MGYDVHSKQMIIKVNNKISKFGIKVYIIYPARLDGVDKYQKFCSILASIGTSNHHI